MITDRDRAGSAIITIAFTLLGYALGDWYPGSLQTTQTKIKTQAKYEY